MAEVAVLGLEDEVWGERVTAVVVPRAGTLDVGVLEALCRDQLADYKVPRQWETVEILPRNAGGKVLKRELRDTLS